MLEIQTSISAYTQSLTVLDTLGGAFLLLFIYLFIEWSVLRARLRAALGKGKGMTSTTYEQIDWMLQRLAKNLERFREIGLLGTIVGIWLAFANLDRGAAEGADLIAYVLRHGLALALGTTLVGLLASTVLHYFSARLCHRGEMLLFGFELGKRNMDEGNLATDTRPIDCADVHQHIFRGSRNADG